MTTFERSSAPAQAARTAAVVVGAHAQRQLTPDARALDEALGGGLAAHLEATGFKGDVGDATVLPTLGRLPAPSVIVVGLGPGPEPTTDALRRAAGTAARRTTRAASVTLALPATDGQAQAVVEGYLLGSYRFDRYKSSAEPRADATVAVRNASDDDLRRGTAIAEGVNWARDLVGQPAGERPPALFAEQAAQRAAAAGLRVEVLDEEELARRGMHGILGVGQGSRFPPRLLVLHYEPPGDKPAKGFLGAIGKGITFDSGGLSLKPPESMETMKTDCSGAAAVAAALCALPALGPQIRVSAALPIAENMPGGGAIKPGDVIRHYGGRTSEVLNTDAEGRLVLADALAWMAEQKPDAMIDFATLTGAMTVALGRKVAGYFATDDALAAELEAAARQTGERIWRMPLLDDLRRQGDSEVADIKNIGTRFGGAIFAALFLREFTAGTPWLHVDIAGPARSEEAEHHIPKGPTGMGARLLIEWIEARARQT